MHYLDIFDQRYVRQAPVSGVVHPSDLNYLRRLYQTNLDSILAYYHERNYSVKNTHILTRLLTHFPPYLNYSSFQYLEYADNKVRYLAKHFDFTSDIEHGVVHPPHFFGNGGEEIILADDATFDAIAVAKNWKNVNPIRTLLHERNDLKLLLPLGTDDGSRGGLASVCINVLKLAVMFREFIREQKERIARGESAQSINMFVNKYILPNMMSEVIDHAVLNRVIDAYYGREIVTPYRKHRFKVLEPDTQIERMTQNTLDVITSKRVDLISLLSNIHLPHSVNAADLLVLPEVGGTRQAKWALVCSRLKHMVFLYDVCQGKDMNRHYFNDWKRLMQRMKTEMDVYDLFSFEVAQELNGYIEKIKAI